MKPKPIKDMSIEELNEQMLSLLGQMDDITEEVGRRQEATEKNLDVDPDSITDEELARLYGILGA